MVMMQQPSFLTGSPPLAPAVGAGAGAAVPTDGAGPLLQPGPAAVQSAPAFPPLDLTPPRPISPLDRWTLRKFNKYADDLDDREREDLSTHILEMAKHDEDHWHPVKERMKREFRMVSLAAPPGVLGHEHHSEEEKKAENDFLFIDPSPWIFASKVASILAGAGFTIDLPSKDVNDITASQKVENALLWALGEWMRRSTFTSVGDPITAMAWHGPTRGWICVRTMPDSSNPKFPFNFEVVDPIYVNPWYAGRGELHHVIVKKAVSVSEAREEYAEAGDMLDSYDDYDTIRIVSYYDEVYQCMVVEGKELSSDSGINISVQAAPSKGRKPYAPHQSSMVKPPVPHGVVDIDDQPLIPWVILWPKGNRGMILEEDDQGNSTASELTGPSILFGLEDTYNVICQTMSMEISNLARSADPPAIIWLKNMGLIPDTDPLTQPGGRVYLAYQESDVKVLDTSPNPGNLQPVLKYTLDLWAKLTLPSVFFGEIAAGTSGYAVNLLTSAAKDIMRDWTRGMETVLREVMRRMLEIYVKVAADSVGALAITSMVDGMDRRVEGEALTPDLIKLVGVDVDVHFGEITPEDESKIAGYILPATAAGLFSKYTARKKMGVKNPMVEERRIFKEMVAMNPEMMMLLGQEALGLSDDEFVKAAAQALIQAHIQAQQQAMQEAGNQAGNQRPMPTSTLPLQLQAGPGGLAGQAPAAQDVAAQRRQQMMDNLARLSGGSLPRGPQG